MTVELLWDNIKILNIEKRENIYISSVYKENIQKVRELGFPIFFLEDIRLVSDELPALVKHRISNINNIKGRLKFKNDYNKDELEDDIYDYINNTECRRPTDKFSIKIEIK